MVLRATEEDDSDSDGCLGGVIEDGERKKKPLFDGEGVPLLYTQEAENMLTRILSCTAHCVTVCEETVLFSSKRSWYGDVVSYVNYKEDGMVPTWHQ